MGISNDGMFGPTRGKVGNLVYYTRNGKSIVRRIGVTDKPATEAQLANWQRMAITTAFCKAVLPFMNYGFMLQIAGKDLNQMNVGVGYNKVNAIKGAYPDLQIDYPRVLLSEGPLLQADDVQVELVEAGIKFNWHVDPALHWPDNTDQVMLLAFFPEDNTALYNLFGPERSKGTALLEISAPRLSEYIETYIGFISADRKQVSTSVYAGAFNPPAVEVAGIPNGDGTETAKSEVSENKQDQNLTP